MGLATESKIIPYYICPMPYFSYNMIEELQDLPPNDKERIMQALHWAISENLPETTIELRHFRDGEHLQVANHDFSDLYRIFELN